MRNKLKTHEVLDLTIHPEDCPGCFVGTLEECNDFVSRQPDYFTYQIAPMTKEEIESYPDNSEYFKTKTQLNKKPIE